MTLAPEQKCISSHRQSYCCNNKSRAEALSDQFNCSRSALVGDLLSASHAVDTELVSEVVFDLHPGKAPDIVGLTGEYLQYCHPSILVLLTKLFQLMILSGSVPNGFNRSYIVPIPKVKDPQSSPTSQTTSSTMHRLLWFILTSGQSIEHVYSPNKAVRHTEIQIICNRTTQ